MAKWLHGIVKYVYFSGDEQAHNNGVLVRILMYAVLLTEDNNERAFKSLDKTDSNTLARPLASLNFSKKSICECCFLECFPSRQTKWRLKTSLAP